ncbi:MAG: peptide transporter ATP-binding protein [Rickettsiaceae bacterium]|jgi:polar amino acid transport system ATP-binding protein|nr:peptide transporter ATP-binding protein [Rickettsiaceae bacterium]
MIKLVKLSKKFGSNQALKEVTLEIKKNDIVAIIGPSGSGKSTLLRCINRLDNPTSGEVYISDKKANKKNIRLICQKIGMVFQNFNLFPHFSVLENLTYGPINLNGLKTEDANQKALELLKTMNLEDKANYKPSSLSGGQKQRIAIARALMMDPEVILFDEPTSALDLEIIKDLISIIEALRAQNITMLIVTHHIGFAKKVSNKIIFMEQGHVLDYMDTNLFFDNPKSHRARLFLESINGIE